MFCKEKSLFFYFSFAFRLLILTFVAKTAHYEY